MEGGEEGRRFRIREADEAGRPGLRDTQIL